MPQRVDCVSTHASSLIKQGYLKFKLDFKFRMFQERRWNIIWIIFTLQSYRGTLWIVIIQNLIKPLSDIIIYWHVTWEAFTWDFSKCMQMFCSHDCTLISQTSQWFSWGNLRQLQLFLHVFHCVKIQIQSDSKINVVNNASVLTGKESLHSVATRLIARVWRIVSIHWLQTQYIFKEPKICIFLTGIDYLIHHYPTFLFALASSVCDCHTRISAKTAPGT